MAGLRACLIHRAHVSLEEDTSILVALQDTAFIGRFDGVIPNELIELYTYKPAEMINVAIGDLCRGHAATVATGGAVDLIFDLLRDRFKSALDEIVPPEPSTETSVLFTVLLPVTLNLYEVC